MADVRRYDPAQPREHGGEHGGRWVKGAGGLAAEGKAALAAAGARLPDRKPGVPDDEAQLSFDDDPGWSPQVRTATSRAVRLYRNSTFREVNNYLRTDSADEHIDVKDRDGDSPVREHIFDDHVLLIDQGMEHSRLSKPVTVWRGVRGGGRTFGDAWDEHDMVGAEWDELGFPSTTADPQVANMFSGDTLLRMHVPAGVGAIQLDGLSSQDRPNAEAELLLQRNLRMRVVKDTPGSGGTKLINGTWTDAGAKVRRILDVEVEVLPEEDG